MESYKHQAAKDTLRNWIDQDPWLLHRGISFRLNDLLELHPALIEFPLCNVTAGPNEKGIIIARAWRNDDGSVQVPQPSYEELQSAGYIVHAILDIGVVNLNRELQFGFEVVHRCPVSHEKAAYLNRLRAVTCEISAEWILCQVQRPEKLKINRIFGYNFWHKWHFDRANAIEALGGATPPPGYEYE